MEWINEKAKTLKQGAIRAMFDRANTMTGVISLGIGEPDMPTPKLVCEAAKEALDKGITHYTPNAGTLAFRQAIAEKSYLKELHYDPNTEIIVTNGGMGALSLLFLVLLNPGDEVLIPTPCWVSYPEMVRMAGGVPVFIPSDERNNFIPTSHDIAARVTRRTKAIILTSPSNPNGSVWSREQLQFVADLAVSHPFYVVSDEIYEKLIYDGQKHVSIAELGEAIKNQTFVVNGMSKAYAMTGWRIGYVAGPRNEICAMTSFQSHATSNANSIAQYAAMKALQGDPQCVTDMVAQFEARRNAMVEKINSIPGLSCMKPQGAFYIMLNITGVMGKTYNGRVIDSSQTFAELLLADKHVAVVPGNAFEAEGFCRLSYAVAMESCMEGLRRIEEFVSELK